MKTGDGVPEIAELVRRLGGLAASLAEAGS